MTIPIILGPTGSGKTGLALELASVLDSTLGLKSEIISADSRAIYRHLDIGTAKPSREEQAKIPHHGLNLVSLSERFTVADWKSYAEQKISEIKSKNHQPIIVGGTGLYIDSLIFDYHFHGPTGAKINDFEQKSCSDRTEIKGDFLLIGLKIPREELRERLRLRIEQMFTPELFAEYKKFVQPVITEHTPPDSQTTQNPTENPEEPKSVVDSVSPLYNFQSPLARAGNIYRFVGLYLSGDLTLEAAKERAFYADYHLAKRQLTWFKRNPAIHWLPPSAALEFILTHLATTPPNPKQSPFP